MTHDTPEKKAEYTKRFTADVDLLTHCERMSLDYKICGLMDRKDHLVWFRPGSDEIVAHAHGNTEGHFTVTTYQGHIYMGHDGDDLTKLGIPFSRKKKRVEYVCTLLRVHDDQTQGEAYTVLRPPEGFTWKLVTTQYVRKGEVLVFCEQIED